MKRIVREEDVHSHRRGSVDGASYLLLVTILGIGMVCGLVTMRDQFAQQFGDVASALEQVNQSYSFTVGTVTSQYSDTVAANPVPNPIGFVNGTTSE
ncbi:MAG: hypothetical protein KF777_11430 [Planctomycetaceae bacterium]|nr:hypothetical protein [Planctomycetaceae bacterium]